MAALHPQIVHFTIVFILLGVAFRLVSLFGRPAWVGPAAATLLILAAPIAFVSERSGIEAHGPVERAPGARAAVVEHEWWGTHVPIAAGVVGLLELAGLLWRKSPKAKAIRIASAVAGVASVVFVYQTAKYGGELVYSVRGRRRHPERRSQGRRAAAARRLLPPGAGRPRGRAARAGRSAHRAGRRAFPRRPRGAAARGGVAAAGSEGSKGRDRRAHGNRGPGRQPAAGIAQGDPAGRRARSHRGQGRGDCHARRVAEGLPERPAATAAGRAQAVVSQVRAAARCSDARLDARLR